ncbi:PP2C family serine/threonine-protein phosphatase [Microvirga sp. VF16]|uniref:PP2C family protein-serine/threonine phosphatase n=1 Tax=Microvirga sp. VF16 TaxID=2807101 RepID=UPI00193D880C|nr:protein phosphatase 2C domain-containing protein [Microvirga sp. VF16]QRM35136.1 serine/threonine-protein phosphatase [Microvirga sp. VF16]
MTSFRHRLTVSAATHRGHIRPTNEDAIAVGHWFGFGNAAEHAAEYFVSQRGILLAVADGLGGHRAGEIASRFLVEQLVRGVDRLPTGDSDAIVDLLKHIDFDLRGQMVEDTSLRGMGSTLAAAIITEGTLTIINVGDSRAYLYDDADGFRQVSVEDVPRAAVAIGLERVASVGSHHHTGRRATHAITQAFGGSIHRTRSLYPHIVPVPVLPDGWTLLLCSDGLTDMVGDQVLCAALHSSELKADALVAKALGAGGEDNVSVILARLEQG